MREKLLRVSAPHFVAGAIFVKGEVGWKCVNAAPIIHWMVGKSPEYLHRYIKRKGWKWEWL